MKVIVYYRESLGWAIKVTASMGVSSGSTVYPTKGEAIKVAMEQHPGKEVLIEE